MLTQSATFLNFINSLKVGQPIQSYYENNNPFIVKEVDLDKKRVQLEGGVTKIKKWFTEIDFACSATNIKLAR